MNFSRGNGYNGGIESQEHRPTTGVVPLRRFKALSFDLDDTLLDGSLFPTSIERTCHELAATQPALAAERLVAANGEAWRVYWPEVEDKWTLGHLDGASLSLEVWRRTLQACGCNDEALAQLALKTHLEFGPETYRLFDDVEKLFSSLKASGIRLALVTNGASDTQRGKLHALDIEHWFDAIVISGEVGIAKPDPAIFHLVIDQLGVDPGSIWHVGDSLVTDVGGAKGAGIFSVWLNRRGLLLTNREPDPDLEIRSLSAFQT